MFSHFKIVLAIFMILTGNLILKTSSSIQSICSKSLKLRYSLLEDPVKAVNEYCSFNQTNSSVKPLSCKINLRTFSSDNICNQPPTLYKTSRRYWFLTSGCFIKNTPIFKINMKILR